MLYYRVYKIGLFCLLPLVCAPAPCSTGIGLGAEEVNRATGDFANQNDPRLSDLFGSGGSNLCWPSALGLEITAQRSDGPSRLDALARANWTRFFAAKCQTVADIGTPLADGVRCINNFFQDYGLRSKVNVIGQRQAGFDQLGDVQFADQAVAIADLIRYVRQDYSLILTTGYYLYDPANHRWERKSGHTVVIKGHVYDAGWQAAKTVLVVVNPAVDYGERRINQRYDRLIVQPFHNPFSGSSIPRHVELAIYGAGFDARVGVHLIENLIAFSHPTQILAGKKTNHVRAPL